MLVRGDADRVPPAGRAAAQRITDQLAAYRLIGTFGERTGKGTAESGCTTAETPLRRAG